jgi:hypothetical protein
LVEFTGHYFEHDWPNVMGVPDNLSLYPYQQRPAIDALFNSYREHTNHHFGGIRIVKELSSAANQCGRKRTLCEAYGAGGWDLRFEDMKRNGDWLYVGGVNTLTQHLSFISLRGSRKQDCPQSFSPHAPWWDAYHVMADYFTRLSLALSSGEEVNKVLVIQPTSTVWMYQADPATNQHLAMLGDDFFNFILNFSKSQLEYDLGSEHSLAAWGKVEGNQLVLQKRKYPVVVLAPHCETLRGEVVELLKQFLAGGGKILCADAPPSLVDARPSDVWQSLCKQSGWKTMPSAQIAGALKNGYPETHVAPRFQSTEGLVFHHRRQLNDGQLLFVVNSSLADPASFTLDSPEGTLVEWDLFQGTTKPVAIDGAKKTFSLLPAESKLLCYSPQAKETVVAAKSTEKKQTIEPLAPPEIERPDLNVLTLDYVDVTAGGETLKKCYFYKANHFVFKKNGMPRGNPWEVTIQFRDETLRHQFPADSGFEATYRFTLEDRVPNNLEIVIERPDLYEITCNGKPVKAMKDAFWLDKSFGRIDLNATAKVGDNEVILRAKPMTVFHEIEPGYLRGDFSLKPAASGFVVIPPQPLTLDAKSEGWNRQGMPFYSTSVVYREKFDLPKLEGTYAVHLPRWFGSVASVKVNGQFAGYIFMQPWECDVTKLLKPGKNEIEVAVFGTLKNLLGAHHFDPPDGIVGDWSKGPENGPPPGDQYDTLGYGLFEPFVLKQN